MSALVEGLLYGWNKNTQYAPNLVDDLTEQQMVVQPAAIDLPPTNHPAWILSHLNAYLPVIASLLKCEPFEDPKTHRFGMQSKPASDRNVYPPKNALIAEFSEGHQIVKELLRGCDEAVFQEPIRLERWAAVMPTVGIALPYLMLNHENLHLGQLSAWRRVQGMPSV